jgi:methionyl-tRNA synthetase
MTKEKILITSALPYVNNVPHLGNMVCVLSADVYSRFMKSKGCNVVSVLGTDEHGTTTEVRAIEEGVTPKQLVDKYYAIHKKIYEWFNTEFDCLGRTSAPENFEISQDIFSKLNDNGYIIEQTIVQMWDEKAEKFLADRFIVGTCPHCEYEEAKGDQCEKCGRLLSPEELKNPKSKLTGTTPVPRKTNHLFIDLKKIEPKLMKWIKTNEDTWSLNAKTTTKGWLKEGLKPRCITRDLKWGIPVPMKGFENKVFYSWFDAPIGYISITAGCRKDWQDWWKKPDETRLVQFMGKDNIPFHTILFPAFCIGADDGYTLMNTISVNEYLNYESGKFSKSRGEGVFCDDAIETGIPADVWRYYIINNRPEKEDTLFTWKDFQEKINKELLGNFGNLVNRTLTFLGRFFDGKVPEMTNKELDASKSFEEITKLLENIDERKAIKAIMTISKTANQYFQDNEPWKVVKEDVKKAGNTLANLSNIVKDLAILMEPFMPHISKEIFVQLNLEQQKWDGLGKPIDANHAIGKPKILFKKLEDKEVEQFRDKFQGKNKSVKTSFADLDLRVSKVIKVEQHPDAEKLYVIDLDVGDKKRTIVSGLVGHYTKEELIGKNIIVIVNLKPAKLRGVKSNGMLLAVGDDDCGLLLAPDAKPGERVFIEGVKSKPKPELDIKQFAEVKIKGKGGSAFSGKNKLETEKEHTITVDKGLEGRVR